ncbi:MAG: CAP domain-containing protein [Calothrix sp. C42_A2020_038]|nr:CAP domain-containing protein [Calothrix sp. C42_A2020_038]
MNTSRKIWFPITALVFLLMGCERAIDYLPPLPRVEIPSEQTRKPTSPQSANTTKIEVAVRTSINQVRQQQKLQPLKNNERLAEVARNYSRKMAEKNFFSHTGVDGSTPASRVEAAGIIYWAVGENLFRGRNLQDPVNIAVKGWLESPGHRANILRSYFAETGVGVWQVNNTYYITQLFLRR